MNIQNIKRAIDFIKTIPEANFSMGLFRNDGNPDGEIDINHLKPECGTVGCIIGHCTALDAENFQKNYIDKAEDYRCDFFNEIETDTMFIRWSDEFFGLQTQFGNNYEEDEESQDYKNWLYMFSSLWATDVNTCTIEHAVYRMQRMIDGYVPEDLETEFDKATEKQD